MKILGNVSVLFWGEVENWKHILRGTFFPVLIWDWLLQGLTHGCHSVTPLRCPCEGSLRLASVMDALSLPKPMSSPFLVFSCILVENIFSSWPKKGDMGSKGFGNLHVWSWFCVCPHTWFLVWSSAGVSGGSHVSAEYLKILLLIWEPPGLLLRSHVILVFDPLNLASLFFNSHWIFLFFVPGDLNFLNDVLSNGLSFIHFVTSFKLETPAFPFGKFSFRIKKIPFFCFIYSSRPPKTLIIGMLGLLDWFSSLLSFISSIFPFTLPFERFT